jgi:Uma2 family endonuclease
MAEYIENGASLGWLIDPLERKVFVYRPDSETEVLENPSSVSGEPLLKNFSLEMKKIWS